MTDAATVIGIHPNMTLLCSTGCKYDFVTSGFTSFSISVYIMFMPRVDVSHSKWVLGVYIDDCTERVSEHLVYFH